MGVSGGGPTSYVLCQGVLDLALDDHLGLRLDLRRRKVVLYFACGSVHHRFIMGRNEPSESWVEKGPDDDEGNRGGGEGDLVPAFVAMLEKKNKKTGLGNSTPATSKNATASLKQGVDVASRLGDGIANIGPSLAALGADLAQKMAMLNQMTADAGIHLGPRHAPVDDNDNDNDDDHDLDSA